MKMSKRDWKLFREKLPWLAGELYGPSDQGNILAC